MSDPCAVASDEDRFECGDNTAGGHDDAHGFIFVIKDVHVRLAIRDDEQRLILQLVPHADAEAFSRPQRRIGIAQTRFLFRGGAGDAQIASQMRDFLIDLVKDFALGKNRGSHATDRCGACEAISWFARADQ